MRGLLMPPFGAVESDMETSARPGRPRPRGLVAGLLLLVVGLVLAGCGSGIVPGPNALIDASQLVATSGVATRSVTSAHFAITVRGTPAGLAIKGAQGDIDAHGTAQGTATTVSATGTPTKVGFILVKGNFYLKDPAGGYRKVDPASAPVLFDLTTLLNPNHGLAHLVQSVDGATTQDIEPMNGVRCFRITGTAQQGTMKVLTPGLRSPSLGMTVWLAHDGVHLPVRIQFTVPRSAGGGTINLTITKVNTPISVTAPAV